MNKHLVGIGISALLLTACGSDGSSTDVTPPPANLPAKVMGTVTQVSADHQQITVNGYKINIANADIRYQQQPLDAKAIQVGMRLDLVNQGQQAKTVAVDPALVGEISAINQNNITVNGIQLAVVSASQYKKGDWVAVNGYPTAVGKWQVESINLFPNFAIAEIEGRVTGLDPVAQQFRLGSALIDYANAELEGQLAEGAWVEVEGQQDGAVFKAHEVDVEDASDVPTFNEMELEGTVTWVNQDKSQFELNSRTRLYVTEQTQFEDGNRSNLLEGKRLEVDIQSTAQGLWAKEVDFESSDAGGPLPDLGNKFELEGRATLDSNNQLQINGFTFIIDARTQFDDGLTLATLDQKWLQIEGVELADGQWLVKEIDLEQQSNELELTGKVSQNSLWGYHASDASLATFDGKWVNVECQFDGMQIHSCRIDD
ncbi:MAG: DUF5666 domain-containing protein [Shewanella sp.]|uniref:DUF5666 domain-containing protein n=1 Tax=Shewanella cutis TaxID=2766780 RepID=A0ABS9R1P4_9GAMM|nr:DUF5666 domain-containing protein [Shewanella sp. PS-2]MCG9965656.1 hypothetical protein [Shewanella sp. PS-2]